MNKNQKGPVLLFIFAGIVITLAVISYLAYRNFFDKETAEGRVCGGPVLTPCPTGYTCQLTTIKSGDLEETSGKCVKN